jgi:hypothetical protein
MVVAVVFVPPPPVRAALGFALMLVRDVALVPLSQICPIPRLFGVIPAVIIVPERIVDANDDRGGLASRGNRRGRSGRDR